MQESKIKKLTIQSVRQFEATKGHYEIKCFLMKDGELTLMDLLDCLDSGKILDCTVRFEEDKSKRLVATIKSVHRSVNDYTIFVLEGYPCKEDGLPHVREEEIEHPKDTP